MQLNLVNMILVNDSSIKKLTSFKKTPRKNGLLQFGQLSKIILIQSNYCLVRGQLAFIFLIAQLSISILSMQLILILIVVIIFLAIMPTTMQPIIQIIIPPTTTQTLILTAVQITIQIPIVLITINLQPIRKQLIYT